MAELPKKLAQKLKDRRANNTLRKLPQANALVDFSSNDYLGFSKNKSLFKRVSAMLAERGIEKNGATGSRLLSGNHELYEQLELKIASFHNTESALVFNSGYGANCGFFSSVPQRGDVIFYDELIHASVRDGIQLGKAKSYKFKHNNLEDLEKAVQSELERSSEEAEFYIVTESVFSMDGDSPDLMAMADFCKKNNCHFVVDEAHAVGVYGKQGEGLVHQLGLERNVFARIITFGKAFGCHGAAIVGDTDLKHYLLNFARSFIYTTGLSPHSVAAIIASYNIIASIEGQEERRQLQKNLDYFLENLTALKLDSHFIPSNSPIQCCVIPGNELVATVAAKLQESGFDVRAIRSPTVPKNFERLRFCIHSYNTQEEISEVLGLLVKFTRIR